MRVLLIYDLPMVDDKDRKIYSRFHTKLKTFGFYMMQYSVYTKVISNESGYNQIKNKIQSIMPDKGNIIIFKITEKQFQDMTYLRGTRNKYETIVGGNELVVFRNIFDD